jgi:hypothetical protein
MSVLLRQAHGFEGFLFRPVLPALHDQSIAQLVDEDVRIANASAGASLPVQHRVQDRRSDHMVASVDQLQYLERDFGERINESVSELLVRIATDVRARVGFVCARVVDEFRVKVGEDGLVSVGVPRREGCPHDLHVLLRHRLLRQPHGFEGFLFRPVLPALHDQSIAQLVDEDVRIANAGASLPVRHRVQDRRNDHMVASVD